MQMDAEDRSGGGAGWVGVRSMMSRLEREDPIKGELDKFP